MKDADETGRGCELTQVSRRCMPAMTGLVSCDSPKNGHQYQLHLSDTYRAQKHR